LASLPARRPALPETKSDWKSIIRARLADILLPHPPFEPELYPTSDSYQERLKRQRALLIWCAFEEDFEFMVTVQFGKGLHEDQLRAGVKRLVALFDHHWLGRKWAKYAGEDRTFFVAFVEHGSTGNVHVHLLLRRPNAVVARPLAGWREREYARCLTREFTDRARRKFICPRGDVQFVHLRSEFDQVSAASYILKDFWKWNSSGPILSNEFHSHNSEKPVNRNADRPTSAAISCNADCRSSV
jgi:hypothetical protein